VVYEEFGVKVIFDAYEPITVAITRRMSVEEARWLMTCIGRAIQCYCRELDKEAASGVTA
jgi:hypothetical protein